MALNERHVAGDAGGQIVQRHVPRQRIGDRGRRHVGDLGVRDQHDTVEDTPALLVAERELGVVPGEPTLLKVFCAQNVAASELMVLARAIAAGRAYSSLASRMESVFSTESQS